MEQKIKTALDGNVINDIVFDNNDEFLNVLNEFLALPEENVETLGPYVISAFQKELAEQLSTLDENAFSAKEKLEIAELYDNMDKAIEILRNDFSVYGEARAKFMATLFEVVIKSFAEYALRTSVVYIPIEICHENAKVPTYANETDAGLDVYALDDITINPGETVLIPTGIKVAIPEGYEIQVRPKSGRALKTKLRVANTPGTIDTGYRDEVKVIIENVEPPIKDIAYHFENGKVIIDSVLHGMPFTIGKGEKFAQLVLNKIEKANFYKVEDINLFEGDRGGGFGSSGLK